MPHCWKSHVAAHIHKTHADKSSKAIGQNFDRSFVYIYTLCMRAAKTLGSLQICAGSHEPTMHNNGISVVVLVFYIPVNNIFLSCQDNFLSSWVEPVLSRGIKCLAQGHNTFTPLAGSLNFFFHNIQYLT